MCLKIAKQIENQKERGVNAELPKKMPSISKYFMFIISLQ